MKPLNVTFLGAGNIGRAMIAGLESGSSRINRRFVIRAVDPDQERLGELRKHTSVATFDSYSNNVAKNTDVLVLAVKPDDATEALSAVKQFPLREPATILSVIAGMPISKFCNPAFGTENVVRAMTNTPVATNDGLTVWMSSPHTGEEQCTNCLNLFNALGSAERVRDENAIDIATAINGAGPAYVLLLMESIIEGAAYLELPRELARELVEEIVAGTAEYEKQSHLHPAELRVQIVSPGGTTAAAMYEAEKGRFRSVISDMMWASFVKARELGGMSTPFKPGDQKY